MAELTVLRVEVTNAGNSKSDSLKSGKGKEGKGLKSTNNKLTNNKEAAIEGASNNTSNLSRKERLMSKKGQHSLIKKDGAISNYIGSMSVGQAAATGAAAVAAVANQGYQMYSNYKIAGYEMSGATHAAAIQGRKGNMATAGAEGLGLIALAAAGPAGAAAAAVILAKKA